MWVWNRIAGGKESFDEEQDSQDESENKDNQSNSSEEDNDADSDGDETLPLDAIYDDNDDDDDNASDEVDINDEHPMTDSMDSSISANANNHANDETQRHDDTDNIETVPVVSTNEPLILALPNGDVNASMDQTMSKQNNATENGDTDVDNNGDNTFPRTETDVIATTTDDGTVARIKPGLDMNSQDPTMVNHPDDIICRIAIGNDARDPTHLKFIPDDSVANCIPVAIIEKDTDFAINTLEPLNRASSKPHATAAMVLSPEENSINTDESDIQKFDTDHTERDSDDVYPDGNAEITTQPDETIDLSDSFGIDEDGEVIASGSDIFPAAAGFMDDDGSVMENLSLYQAIAGDEKDDNLVQSFQAWDRESQMQSRDPLNQDEVDQANVSQLKKHRAIIVPRERTHESQALFDILDRDFASLSPRVESNSKLELTSDEIKLCFVAFVTCFSPPLQTQFAKEYNHNLDEIISRAAAKAKISEQNNRGLRGKRSRWGVLRGRKQSSKGEHSEDETGSEAELLMGEEEQEVEEQNKPNEPPSRPFVPTHIVEALWREVIRCKRSSKSANNSSIAVHASVLSSVRDSLVLLGVLDVRKLSGNMTQSSSMGINNSHDHVESVLTMNDILDDRPMIGAGKQTPQMCEFMSVHQAIHQEYGEYLAIEEKLLVEFDQRWNQAISSSCSRDPGDETDASYALQMLPYNMVRAGRFGDAASLLAEKKFIHMRLRSLGILEGLTAHVTDIEELLFQFYDQANTVDHKIDPADVMVRAYGQMLKAICRQVEDNEERASKGSTSYEVAAANGAHTCNMKLTKTEAGKGIHLMAVSFGAQSHVDEEMEYYIEALRLKRSALEGSDTIISVTLSDTLHCIGFAFDNAGDYLQALEYYNDALGIRQTLLGNDDLRVAETLHNKGAILCENGDCDVAITCLEEALRIRHLHYGDTHEVCADTQQWIGNVMREWEEYDDALGYFKTALQIKKSTLGDDHEDVANTLQNMAVVLDEMGKYSLSLGCYTDVLRIRKLCFGVDNLQVAGTLQFMANIYAVTEEHALALEIYNQAIAIREKFDINEDNREDERFVWLESLIYNSDIDENTLADRYGKLIECYQEALPLTKLLNGTDDTSLGTILHRMGELYWKVHDWDNAIGSFQGALRVQRAHAASGKKDDSELCALLQKKGIIHIFRNENQKARIHFESVIHRRKRMKDADAISDAVALYCLGVAIHNLKVHNIALLSFTESLRILSDTSGEGNPNCGHALYWMGRQEEENGNCEKALTYYRGALHNYKSNKNNIDYAVVVKTFEYMGGTHEKLKAFDLAIKCYVEAVRLISLRLHANHESAAKMLCRLGNLTEQQGDTECAIHYFERAISVMKECARDKDLTLCVTTEKLGSLNERQGDYESAKDALSEAYRLYEGCVGQDHLNSAAAVFKLGQVLDIQGSSDAAMQCYKESLRVRKMKLGRDHEDVATTLFSMGSNLMEKQKHNESIEFFQQSLSIRRSIHGDGNDIVSETLYSLAKAYCSGTSFDKAIVCFKEALRVKKENEGSDTLDVARISYDTAEAHEANMNYEAAIQCYSEAIRIWQNQPINDERIPGTLHQLGLVHDKVGDNTNAVSCFTEALEFLKEGKDFGDVELLASLHSSLARSYALTGAHDSAIESYVEHIETIEQLVGHEEKASDSLYAIGTIFARKHDLQSAIDYFIQCLRVRKEYFGETDERVARVLVNLAVVHEKRDDFLLAKESLTEAHRIYKMKRNEKEASATLELLGRILKTNGDIDASIECYEEALLSRRNTAGPNDPHIASTLHACACGEYEREEYSKALTLFQEAFRIRKVNFSSEHTDTTDTLFMIGKTRVKIGLHKDAIDNLKEALELRKKAIGPDSLEVANCYHYLGLAHNTIGQHDIAMNNLRDSLPARKKYFGDETEEVAETYQALGGAYGKLRKWENALDATVQALRIRKVKLGNDTVDCAHSLLQLGDIQDALDRSSEALKCYKEAVRVFTLKNGKKDVIVGETLEKIGGAYFKKGDFDNAIGHLKAALVICRDQHGDSCIQVASVLLTMGKVEYKKGDWDSSISYYKQSLKISKEHGHESAVASVLIQVGEVLESRGDNSEALECYKEVIRMLDSSEHDELVITSDGCDGHTASNESSELIAKSYNQIGGIYAEIEEFDEALKSFQKALSLHKKSAGEDCVEVGHTMHNIAGVHEALAEYDKSLDYFLKSLRILEDQLSNDDLSVALAMNNLGINYARRGEYAKALEFCTDALRIRRAKLGFNHLDSCDALYNVANILDEWGKDDQALNFYTEALGLYRANVGDDDLEVANCFQYIGTIHLRNGEEEYAFRAYVEALRIYQLENEETLSVASILFNLGQIYKQRSENDKAFESFAQCLRIRKGELDTGALEIGEVFEQIGSIYKAKKKQPEAIKFYNKAFHIYEKKCGKESIQYARVLMELAGELSEKEEYDDALSRFQDCLTIFKEELGEESDEVAEVLVRIGVIHNKRVDYEEALRFLTSAVKIRTNIFGRDSDRVSDTLFEIGCVLEEWGDSDEAIETYQEVSRITRINHGPNHITVAKVLKRLGNIYAEREDYTKALETFHDALGMERQLLGDNAVQAGHTIISMAGIHDSKEEFESAFAAYTDALGIFQKSSGDEDISIAFALNNMGINQARRKEFQKAIELCSEALRLRKLKFGDQHLDIADSYLNIANVLDEWGKKDQALKFYNEALELYRSNLGEDDTEVANCLRHTGSIHMHKNEHDRAITCYVESIRIYKIKQGNDCLDIALVLFNLGRIYGKRAEYEKASACFNECLRIRTAELGVSNLDVIAVHRYIDAIKRKMRR